MTARLFGCDNIACVLLKYQRAYELCLFRCGQDGKQRIDFEGRWVEVAGFTSIFALSQPPDVKVYEATDWFRAVQYSFAWKCVPAPS